jgi:hypothetical protein
MIRKTSNVLGEIPQLPAFLRAGKAITRPVDTDQPGTGNCQERRLKDPGKP